MANLQSIQASTLDAGQYGFTGYLSTPTEESVLEGTLTANAAEPAFYVTYTLTGGATADVETDMEIIFLSSANAFKGRARVALSVAGNALSSTNLPINELSKGRLKLVTGDKFRVVRSWRLRDMLVGATATFPKDSRLEYLSQNADVDPTANNGGLWVGWHDPGQVYATVEHYGSRSYAMDSDNVSGVDVLHDVKDGTITVGTSTTPDITVQYPIGERWIDFTAEDADNGESFMKHTWVRVHSANDPPLKVKMLSLNQKREQGWRGAFEVTDADAASLDTLPEGALIVYWEDEYYGAATTPASYGSSIGRSHIKFVGFLQRETIRNTAADGSSTLTFEAVSTLEILRQIAGFSQVLTELNAPGNWQQYKGLTVKRMIHYMLRWHTTFLRTFDLIMNFEDKVYPSFYIQQSNPLEQIKEVAHGRSALVECGATGAVVIDKALQRRTTAERAATVTSLAMTAARVGDLEHVWEHRVKYRELEAKGFSAGSGPVPMKSVAPGEAPAEGDAGTTVERLIEDNQTTLDGIAGHAYADECALYDGKGVPKDMKIAVPPSYGVIDLSNFEYITLDYAAVDTSVGSRRSFVGANMVPKEIDIQYDVELGTKTIVWTVDHETRGEAGTPRPVETNPDWDFTNPIPPTTPVVPGPANPGLRPGSGTIIFIDSAGRRGLTNNFGAQSAIGGPNWAMVQLSISGTLLDWIPDAFSSLYMGTGDAVDGWGLTTTGIYRFTNLNKTTAAATLLQSLPATAVAGMIQMERGKRNWVMVVIHVASAKYRAFFSLNGTSFTESTFATATGTVSSSAHPVNVWMSPASDGRVELIAFDAFGAVKAWESSDFGANFSEFTTPVDMSGGTRPSARLERPWREDVRHHRYFTKATGTTPYTYTLYKWDGTSLVDRSPVVSATKYPPSGTSFRELRVDDDDPNTVVCVGRPTNTSNVVGVFVSIDGALTWLTRVAPSASNWQVYTAVAVVRNALWLWGGTGRIFFSPDKGATIDERTGDWPYTSPILNIAGG